VAVLNGIVLISEFNDWKKDGFEDITERVIKRIADSFATGVIMNGCLLFSGFLAYGNIHFGPEQKCKNLWQPVVNWWIDYFYIV